MEAEACCDRSSEAVTIQQAFALALQHYQSGRLAEAEALCRQILAVDPRHADAFHVLGVIALRTSRTDLAVDSIRQAIALKSDCAEAHYNLGIALQGKGQLDEAISACRQAIVLQPDYADAHYSLGNVLNDIGRQDEAIASYRRAIALKPGCAEFHNNLGTALRDKGRLDEAIAACRQSIAFKPNYADAHYNLGNALKDIGQRDEAIASYRLAITLRPNYIKAHGNLGTALYDNGQLDEAIAAYHRAIALKPDSSEVHSNLGTALYDNGQLDEAIAAYRQAIALQPDLPEAHSNLGNALQGKGQLANAVAAYRRAIALKPDFPKAHVNLAYALLVEGDFLQGWDEYEWRWKLKDVAFSQRNFSQPQWDGRSMEGRTLLLHAEQGFGDAIQFIRYLPLVAQRGGNIILECQPELRRLFQTMASDLPVLARGESLPSFDVHSPLLALPRVFSTGLGDIPRTVPYLRTDAAGAAIWCERLAGSSTSLKVGLVWAGHPTHKNDRQRSLKLASLAPLAEVGGVRFISLQKAGTSAEARTPPAGMELIDVAEELQDFADTAALISNLDLVIAVDTAVAHLAGAMGQPVWTLLPFAPDWRWLLERSDSPWYPTMRLFRQPSIGDWDAVIAEVREQLQALVNSRMAKP